MIPRGGADTWPWSLVFVFTELPGKLVANPLDVMQTRPLLFDDDPNLYEALLRHDDRAYDWLYTQLYPQFRYWMNSNSGTDADAEDTFQKGLMSFFLNLETGKYQYQAGTKVTTVIFDYCKKAWFTELKSARNRHATAMPEEVNLADTDDALQELVRNDTIEAVRGALAQLKEGCRQLMQWFYIDQDSLRDIAGRMGLKETSVKSKRYECTEQLKRAYQQIANRRGL